jgi:ribosomal protein S4E
MFVFRDAIYFTLMDQQDSFVDRIYMKHVKSALVKSCTSVQSNDTALKVDEGKNPLVRKFSRILTQETVSEEVAGNQVLEGISLQYYPEFQIDTLEEGDNQGRTYHLRTQTKKECESIVEKLTKYSEKAKLDEDKESNFKRSQLAVLKICKSRWYRTMVGGLILAVRQYRHLLLECLLTFFFCRTTQ